MTIFFQILITAGALGVGALAVAFAMNDLTNKIDDNKKELSTLETEVITLTNNMDSLGTDQTSICTKVSYTFSPS